MTISTTQFKSDFLPPAARAVAPYFVLLLAVFAAYSNIFDNAFVFDDDLLIVSNTYLHGEHLGDLLRGSTTSGAHIEGGFYRPVQMLLYLLMFNLGGGSAFLFHLLNLSLHAANTCFVYKLGMKLRFNPWSVFLAALLWGVHPLHTEAITYMSATADPLFTFFCLWAVISVLPDITLLKILKIIPLFLLGLGSKETAIILPLLLMTCMFLTSPKRLDYRTYWSTWPLWIISLCYGVWCVNAQASMYANVHQLTGVSYRKMYTENLLYRFYTFLATIPAYLRLLVWPKGLHMERSFPMYMGPWFAPVLLGMSIFILSAAQIMRSCKKPGYGLEMSWGLLWFAAAHAPDSGVLIPVNSLFLEHWMYLPSVGLFLGTGETIAKALRNFRRPLSFISFATILFFVGLMVVKTYEQNKIWHDPVSFYNNIFAYGEPSARAHSNLGGYYVEQGDLADAKEQFKQSISITDDMAVTRYNLAVAYMHEPDRRANIQAAIENLNRAIEIDPNFYQSYVALGMIYDVLDDKDKAKYYRDRAGTILPQK